MVSDCGTYLELFNYNISPMKHGLFLYLARGLIFLFQRTVNSGIYLILWKCTTNRGSRTRWRLEALSNQHFYHCLIKDTAVNHLQPWKLFTFGRSKDSNRSYVYSFQKEKSFERKMRPRHGNMSSSNCSALAQL